MFLGPLKERPDDFVDQRFRHDHLAHQQNDLVASFDAALGFACVGSDGRQRNALVDHGKGGESVVDQTTHEFQIEVVDEVVRHDAGDHADAREAGDDHRVLVFNGGVDSETRGIHARRWGRVPFNTFPVLTPNLHDERRSPFSYGAKQPSTPKGTPTFSIGMESVRDLPPYVLVEPSAAPSQGRHGCFPWDRCPRFHRRFAQHGP